MQQELQMLCNMQPLDVVTGMLTTWCVVRPCNG
jgi:hypothetical protein